jgi:hypothetical protein
MKCIASKLQEYTKPVCISQQPLLSNIWHFEEGKNGSKVFGMRNQGRFTNAKKRLSFFGGFCVEALSSQMTHFAR